jgi:hypothetical protein
MASNKPTPNGEVVVADAQGVKFYNDHLFSQVCVPLPILALSLLSLLLSLVHTMYHVGQFLLFYTPTSLFLHSLSTFSDPHRLPSTHTQSHRVGA